MATKYFVYEGLLFTTEDVLPSAFGLTGTTPLECVTLESVAEALGGTSTTEGVLRPTGDTPSARLIALKGWWTATKSDAIQELFRQFLKVDSDLLSAGDPPVVGDPVAGTRGSPARAYHRTSYQYILPTDLSLCINSTPAMDDDTNKEAARTRLIVKSLEVRHDHIAKHEVIASGDQYRPTGTEVRDSVTDAQAKAAAWLAWRRYILSQQIGEEAQTSSTGYFEQ